jgi:hypothetical protein
MQQVAQPAVTQADTLTQVDLGQAAALIHQSLQASQTHDIRGPVQDQTRPSQRMAEGGPSCCVSRIPRTSLQGLSLP